MNSAIASITAILFLFLNTAAVSKEGFRTNALFLESGCLGISINSSNSEESQVIHKIASIVAAFSGRDNSFGDPVNDMSRRENMYPHPDPSSRIQKNIPLSSDSYSEGGSIALIAGLVAQNPKMQRRTFLRGVALAGIFGVSACAKTVEKNVPFTQQESPTIDLNLILKHGYDFMKHDVGIDEKTELPFERLTISGNRAIDRDNRTQPTLIGFYVQFLIDVAKGNATVDFMNKRQAEERLLKLLSTLRNIQRKYGWEGLLPTWGRVEGGYSKDTNAYATGDNFNLSTKVFMILGAFAPEHELYGVAKDFLDAQKNGYEEMYDVRIGFFSGERANGVINRNYRLDRISNEFSSGVAWAVNYYDIDTKAFMNLSVGKNDGDNVLKSWNGDGFEMGWHLLTFDETKIPEFEIAHYNYLLTMMQLSKKDGQPGLRSPSDDPAGGYAFSGYRELREGGEITDQVWSAYTLGAYAAFAPQATKAWLENLTRVPGMVGALGFFDAGRGNVTGEITVTNTVLGIDHLSFLVGMHGKGPTYFDAALDRIDKKELHYEMYRKYGKDKLGHLKKIPDQYPNPPVLLVDKGKEVAVPIRSAPAVAGNQLSIGMRAEVTELGYRQVVEATKNLSDNEKDEEMKKYIVRVAFEMGKRVTDQGGLSGFAHWYSGCNKNGVHMKQAQIQTLSKMKQELRNATWLQDTDEKGNSVDQSMAASSKDVGDLVGLSEEGYQQVIRATSNLNDYQKHRQMEKFITRVVKSMGKRVKRLGDLTGFAHWYSGCSHSGGVTQSYARMQEELNEAGWISWNKPGHRLPDDSRGTSHTFVARVTPQDVILGSEWSRILKYSSAVGLVATGSGQTVSAQMEITISPLLASA